MKHNKSRKSVKSRKSRKSRKSKCREYLKDKIAMNINEMKEGRYISKSQAIAVAYSQIRKKHPSCKRILTRKNDK